MLLANAPGKLTTAFATGGDKNVIPVPSQIPIAPGAASWTTGFPPLTMTAVNAGGVPPSGLDFNGIFNALSALSIWYNAGAGFLYDAAFATSIGGYPIGARVLSAIHEGYWMNTVDNNTSNPDTGGAGWIPFGMKLCASVYASAQQSLPPGESKVVFDTVEFDDNNFWDATNKRFHAPLSGKYRMNGSILLTSPSGQNFSVQIYRNGVIAKQCSGFPQVSDGDLTFPLDAIIPMSLGDYLEVFMSVTQTSVNVGLVGSNQPYVFAQLEYLGA